jgi:hypothetical protein
VVAEFVDNDCLDQVPPAAGLTGADARKMDGGAPTVGYDRDPRETLTQTRVIQAGGRGWSVSLLRHHADNRDRPTGQVLCEFVCMTELEIIW